MPGSRVWHGCFPVNFVKFLRTSFFIEHLWWLLLHIGCTLRPNHNFATTFCIGSVMDYVKFVAIGFWIVLLSFTSFKFSLGKESFYGKDLAMVFVATF